MIGENAKARSVGRRCLRRDSVEKELEEQGKLEKKRKAAQ